jgi:thiol-disulfide isomerase/thioredoxin
MRNINLSTLLLVCYTLSLSGAMVNVSSAAQDDLNSELYHTLQETVAHQVYGRITDIQTASGISYIEIDTGKERVWSAGPVNESLKIGDSVAISTSMPMKNFHSKGLDRDFPVIYFVKQFTADKATSEVTAPLAEHDGQQPLPPAASPAARTSDEVEKGSYLREAMLNGLNTGNKSLAEYKGKPLIINVWASWCGPCRAEMGSLEHLAQQYNGKQFNIIGISTDDCRDKAADFIEQTKLTFASYIDHNLMMEHMLGATTIPLTVLVGADGRVLTKVRGSREWDSPEMMKAIGQIFQIDLAKK